MKGALSKARHTIAQEGLGSFIGRFVRYAAYRARRATTDTRTERERWRELRGAYQGKRAFLIGNGPSLNLTPLYLLGDEFTMCFNRWELMSERLSWQPTFYSVIDDRVLLDNLEEANRAVDRVRYAFFPDIHPYNVDFRHRIVWKSNVYKLFLDRVSFSDTLPYCGINKTVANVGLQILAFLGFTEIYLLGVDMSYSVPNNALRTGPRDITATEDNDDSHYDPRYFGAGRKFHVPMLEEAFVKFREAREFFGARGVEIQNATFGGVLEEFPRVQLNDVLKMATEEVRTRFYSTIQSKLSISESRVERLMQEATMPASPDEMQVNDRACWVPQGKVQDFIRGHVHGFIPFGPFEGAHLFVNRGLVESDVPEAAN